MITLNEIKEVIENNPLFLATSDKQNRPHCIVVAEARVISHNQIIITDNHMIQTKRNIQGNSNIALAVLDKNQAGYKMNGHALYYIEGGYFEYVQNMPENRGFPAKGAIVISIKDIRQA